MVKILLEDNSGGRNLKTPVMATGIVVDVNAGSAWKKVAYECTNHHVSKWNFNNHEPD